VTGSLSSLVSAANLSTTIFLNGFCLPGAAGTGLAEGETCLCEAKTGQAEPDWLVFLPREAGLASPDAPPGITSWDVLPSLTSRRSRPRLLPKAAMRPLMLLSAMRPTEGGIPSCRSQSFVLA